MGDIVDFDCSRDEGMFLFERIDVIGPSRLIIRTFPLSQLARQFRAVNAKFPARVVKFFRRSADHPDCARTRLHYRSA